MSATRHRLKTVVHVNSLSPARNVSSPAASMKYRNGEEVLLIREQILQRIAGQSAKTHPCVPVCPPPHHAAGSEAPEKLRPEHPVKSRKESYEYPVFEPFPPAGI